MNSSATGSTRPRIAVADTGSGNLRSVEKALVRAGADVVVTADADVVAAADKIVVPGQGAFGGCMAGLARDGGALGDAVVQSIRPASPTWACAWACRSCSRAARRIRPAAGWGSCRGRSGVLPEQPN